MYLFYFLSLLPLIAGAILWLRSKEVVWWEWIMGSLIAFLLSALFHWAVFKGLTDDTETFSGLVTGAVHQPEWVEKYTATESYTDSKGHSHSRKVTRYITHHERFDADCDFITKKKTIPMSKMEFHELASLFGRTEKKEGHRPGFHSGDRYDYTLVNINHYTAPCTTLEHFENRIKASDTIFSFIKVPKEIQVFEYPENTLLHSKRLLGDAALQIDAREFDLMNSRLGPFKKVNMILIGFNSKALPILGQYQESKWIRGKKNDLVLCYGSGENGKPSWAYCFGWTEKELVKRNLETILLDHSMGNDLLPLIEKEIIANYELKDWSQFDYITIYPPLWTYFLFLFILALIEGAYYFFYAMDNEYEKKDASRNKTGGHSLPKSF